MAQYPCDAVHVLYSVCIVMRFIPYAIHTLVRVLCPHGGRPWCVLLSDIDSSSWLNALACPAFKSGEGGCSNAQYSLQRFACASRQQHTRATLVFNT